MISKAPKCLSDPGHNMKDIQRQPLQLWFASLDTSNRLTCAQLNEPLPLEYTTSRPIPQRGRKQTKRSRDSKHIYAQWQRLSFIGHHNLWVYLQASYGTDKTSLIYLQANQGSERFSNSTRHHINIGCSKGWSSNLSTLNNPYFQKLLWLFPNSKNDPIRVTLICVYKYKIF